MPRHLRTGSKGDSVEEVRNQIKRNNFDHGNFNIFLASKFCQYLLEGIDDETDKHEIERVS